MNETDLLTTDFMAREAHTGQVATEKAFLDSTTVSNCKFALAYRQMLPGDKCVNPF